MQRSALIAMAPFLIASFTVPTAFAAPTPSPTPTTTATPKTTPRPTASPARTAAATPPRTPAATAAIRTPTAAPSPTPTPTPTPEQARAAIAAAATPIDSRWQSLGGAAGTLGAPIGEERPIAGGAFRDYANGTLYWSRDTGAKFVRRGPVLDRYRAIGGPAAAGFPIVDQRAGAAAAQVLELPASRIVWGSATGARWVYGAIFAKYRSLGAESGFLGLPTSEEFTGRDGRSRISNFTAGTIVFHPSTGTFEVHGAILDKWRSLGGEGGFLGTPTSDELVGNNGGRSRLSIFAGGTVIYTPGVGTFEVHGAIRDRYVALGREGGPLGGPSSDEFTGAPGARVNRFERGLIIWRPETGAWAVRGAILDEYARHRWEAGDLGAPIGNEFTTPNGWGQDFQNGRILFEFGGWRIQPRLNAYVRAAAAGDVRHTYRSGCPIGPASLRVIEMNYLNYEGRVARGMVVVRDDAVDRTIRAFQAGATGSFPIAQMLNPDVYNGDDPAQMRANNTSAFNCRSVVGNPYAQSPHSYGRAIDVNPVQNPYYDGRKWWPENGTRWINRNLRDRGMLFADGPLTRGMTSNGFFWGGNWANKDYHHFQVN